MTSTRVLVVSWQLPYPPDQGGRIRSFHLLRALTEIADVTLVSFTRPGEERHVERLTAEGFRVVAVPSPAAAPRWWHHLANWRPLLAQQYVSARMMNVVEEAQRETRPDVAVVDGLVATEYRAALGTTPALYASHNIEAEIYERMLPWLQGTRWRRWVARADCMKSRLWERERVRQFSHVTVVSERDGETVRRWNRRVRLSVVPNGVDSEYFRLAPGSDSVRHRIVFLGDLSYPPNHDGVLFFAREVVPLIRKAEPGATWHVLGRSTPELTAALAGHPGVVTTGYVPDVRPHVAQAEVVVVPLRAGGGTRLKILEALAMGRPVVSTAIGAEGLKLRQGITIADSPTDLAVAVLSVLRNPARAAADAAAARPALLATYDWAQVARGFQAAVAALSPTTAGASQPTR